MKNSDWLVLAMAAAAGYWYYTQEEGGSRPPAPVQPSPCPGPGPCPAPTPKPKPKPKAPWGDLERSPVGESATAQRACGCCPNCKCELSKCPCRLAGAPGGGRCSRACECCPPLARTLVGGLAGTRVGAQVGGTTAPDGTEIQIDLPGELHQKNTGGSDGAGLCVYASARHSGLYQNNTVFAELFQWMRQHPGGSYPEKFDRTVEEFCREKGLPKPAYLQVEGKDLEVLKLACKTGRMPGVTYCFSPTGRYNGQRIAHMTSLVHADGRNYCILDNNYPGANQYEWLSEDEFQRSYTGGKSGWAIILLDPGPPPPPRN